MCVKLYLCIETYMTDIAKEGKMKTEKDHAERKNCNCKQNKEFGIQ
jgi:hypothetical protein